MAVTQEFIDYVLEQMRRVPGVLARKMFGGAGLSVRGLTFAIIDDDVLYLKVDDTNRPDYEAAGMKAFAPNAAKPDYVMPYYEVPAEVLEDPAELAEWTQRSIAVAERAAAKKPAKKTPEAAAKSAAKKSAAVKKSVTKKAPAKKAVAKKAPAKKAPATKAAARRK